MGPPNAGKSTWARKLASAGNSVRLNRDEFRTMFNGGYIYGNKYFEELCTKATYAIAKRALKDGKNVILDNTNCSPKTIMELLFDIGKLQGEGIEVEIEFVLFEIPYWKQRYRNFWRWAKGKGPWIPSEVSKRMHASFEAVKDYLDGYSGGLISRGN